MSLATPPDVPRYSTAADWWSALGNVPLERIVFDPWPGTATEADVLRLDDHEDRVCELIDGTLVEKTMGIRESIIATEIARHLGNFVAPRKLGLISGADGMLRLLAGRVRIPDVAFISFARLPGGKLPDQRIPAIAPDLAVEVLSESNTAAEMNTKLREYFAAGTRLVWYVDPETRTVDVYTSPENRQQFGEADVLTGGDVLPGFELPGAMVFPTAP